MGCGSSQPVVDAPSQVDFGGSSKNTNPVASPDAFSAGAKPSTSITPGEALPPTKRPLIAATLGGDANNSVATDTNSSSVISASSAARKKPPRKGTVAASNHHNGSAGSPMKRLSLTKKKGGNSNNSASQQQPTTTRLRADTWETTLTDDLQPDRNLLEEQAPFDEESDDLIPPTKDPSLTTSASPRNKGHPRQNGGEMTKPSKPKFAIGTTDGAASTIGPVQEQWRTLWETQSAALVDPADVVAVLDQLVGSTINQLSAVQTTLLLRKVRSIASRELPKTDGNHSSGSTSSKIVKVFAGTSNSNHQYSVDDTEARTVLDKCHLLTPSFLQRLLPKSSISASVTESIITLMMALDTNATTSIPLERVVTAATSAAEAIGMEMDVNRISLQSNKKFKMSKPSQIPVFLDDRSLAEHWPLGASLRSVATFIAMGTADASSREQKLQLLFYISMDPTVLREFLISHPAGGIPLWLLEVGHSTVLSLPSLTHYHYFGNAFVPCAAPTNSNGQQQKRSSFIPSKSRTPVSVDANYVQSLARQILERAVKQSCTSPTDAKTTNGGDLVKMDEQQQRNTAASSYAVIRRSSSLSDMQPSDLDANLITATAAEKSSTTLMQKLMNVSEGMEIDLFSPCCMELCESLQTFERENAKFLEQFDVSDWTIQEFKQWADQTLDDLAIQVIMHHFFAEGILPSPMMERDLVCRAWSEWEKQQQKRLRDRGKDRDGQSITEMLSNSVISFLGASPSTGNDTKGWDASQLSSVWGGIGGIDGLGGAGYGVLYCLPTSWWNAWKDYTGWTFVGEPLVQRRKGHVRRPYSLETEGLLEKDPDAAIRGIMGSYEVMRPGLKLGMDYVLIPPGVWEVLFELYSGGPPLPRMVQPREKPSSFISLLDPDPSPIYSKSVDEPDGVDGNGKSGTRIMKLSDRLFIEAYPWVLQVHLCDPSQPYRRGDTGPVSIRVMASPTQPLWRLLSEIVVRFSFKTYRAFDADMRGRVRLWKKIESNDSPLPRYGPWNLLCKSRYALLPCLGSGIDVDCSYEDLVTSWKQYGDHATVESIGLLDQASLMVEFAVQNRNGELTWPREAAAQAGKVRRLAEEDKHFRQVLLGIDDNGKPLANPPSLVGMDVDAMEFSGKWYTVKILEVVLVETVAEEEDDEEEVSDTPRRIKKKRVRVNFREHGGHMDWIDVDSDRLQTPGRFASEADLQSPETPTNGNGSAHGSNDGRSKSGAGAKRSNSTSDTVSDNTKSCALPGFGACGLTNLGNTCYMNSAIQCMAYLPLLRAYLLSTQYKTTNDINKNNPLGTSGRLLEEFAELLRSVWSTRFAEKSPTRFRMHLGKCNEQFSGADQQDAQEFLNYMIDVLHEDSNRVRKKPYVEALEDLWVNQTSLPRVGEESWRR
jgi:Ubiquitin carboxyl-terminal hydrolase/DUSP domain